MGEFPRSEEEMNFVAPPDKVEKPEELDEDGLTAEEREYAAGKMEEVAKKELVQIEHVEDKVGIEEMKGMIERFKAIFPSEKLRSVSGISVDEAPTHPIREPARRQLNDIREAHKKLNAPKDIQDEVDREIRILWKDLGVFRGGRLSHD